MHEIRAYHCDFCKKFYKNKSSALRHEKECFYNPENRACITCGNFKKEYNTMYVPPHEGQKYGDADYDVEITYCDYDKKTLGEDKPFQTNCENWIEKESEDMK